MYYFFVAFFKKNTVFFYLKTKTNFNVSTEVISCMCSSNLMHKYLRDNINVLIDDGITNGNLLFLNSFFFKKLGNKFSKYFFIKRLRLLDLFCYLRCFIAI